MDLASKTTDCCAEKERNQVALERCQALAVIKESVPTEEKTAAEEKAEKIQKLKSGFRICKPQGTFLWPNMAPNNGSSPVVVQVEDLFMVHTPPSVSSSTASAPPHLPYHHHHPPSSPIRPVPERRAVTVTVKTARSNDQKNANHGYSATTIIASPRSKGNTTLINLNDIPDTDGAFATAATKRHVSITIYIDNYQVPNFPFNLCKYSMFKHVCKMYAVSATKGEEGDCICLGVRWEQPMQQRECFCCGKHSWCRGKQSTRAKGMHLFYLVRVK